jgi:type I restriction enzyme M protein
MWRRIEVRNYRSIEKVKVDLAPFTVVVGPNGSGKSNFADAFVFARDIANDASTAVQNRGGIAGVRRWRPSKPLDVTIDVRVAATQAELNTDYVRHGFTLASKREGQWEFKRELIEEQIEGKHVFVFERERNHVKIRMKIGRSWRQGSSTLNSTSSAMLRAQEVAYLSSAARLLQSSILKRVHRYRLNPETMRQPQLVTERNRLDESGGNIAVTIRALRENPEKWAPVLMTMQRLIPGLHGIEEGTLGRYMGVRFFQKQAGVVAEFSATEMSEGAIRALGILIAAQQMSQDELLVLEEPEVSIHPGAATVLFSFLKQASRRGAVLLTTHSAELLDAAKDEEILVCDYREGITRVGPMEKAQRRLVKDGLLSAAELMRSEPLRIEGMPPDVIPHEEAR